MRGKNANENNNNKKSKTIEVKAKEKKINKYCSFHSLVHHSTSNQIAVSNLNIHCDVKTVLSNDVLSAAGNSLSLLLHITKCHFLPGVFSCHW